MHLHPSEMYLGDCIYLLSSIDIAERAKVYSHEVKDMMDKVRDSADHLEMLIDDEMWPLPKYRELLFF